MNCLQTDLPVDKSFHDNLSTLNQKNPLVHNLLWGYRPSQKKMGSYTAEPNDVEWRDTYSLVCNMANLYTCKKSSKTGAVTRSKKISELEKLSIAIQMSYGSKSIHTDYVYKPRHMVYDELCMVVSFVEIEQ